MSSSSIAVVGGGEEREQLHTLALANTDMQESSTSLTELESDLTSYQHLEDVSPGTIIFSPQDLRSPLTAGKRTTVTSIGLGGGGYHQRAVQQRPTGAQAFVNQAVVRAPTHSTTSSGLTAAERKAEKIAMDVEKLKDSEGPCACQFCGRVMLSGKTLVQHMSIHAEYKPFQCPHCDKSFTRKVQLQGHLVIHGIEKQFECPVCHQRFSRRDCVKVHMRIHDKSKCAFCEVCHKSFLTVGALNIHMRIHRGEKPFKCHLCGKCFTQKNHLITHIKRHTNVQDVHYAKKLGPRMFQCEHCPRSFIRLSDYERHVQWNHGAVADVNNVNSNNGHVSIVDDDCLKPIKAPRDVIRERSKPYKKKRDPIVMCTSATQTDEDGGHIIIPRQYKHQFDLEQRQKQDVNASDPSDTPRHMDEDTYDADAFDDDMDRNYSSDEDDPEMSEANQPPHRIFNINSTAMTASSKDAAQDAAFDAIINSHHENSLPKTKYQHNTSDDAEHILPDSLDADQPNERVFIIQNETDSYEPSVTTGDSTISEFPSVPPINVSSSSTTSASTITPTTEQASTKASFFSARNPKPIPVKMTAEQQQQHLAGVKPAHGGSVATTDLNRHLGSDNFIELVQNSYQSLAKGEAVLIPEQSSTSNPVEKVGMDTLPYVGSAKQAIDQFNMHKRKRGRPRTKRLGMKGAAQLLLIRKSMQNFISDAETTKESSKKSAYLESSDNSNAERREDEIEEAVGESTEEEMEAEDGTDGEDVCTDTRSALEEQVLMGVSDAEVKGRRTLRRSAQMQHGKDFLCQSKKCRFCRPALQTSAGTNKTTVKQIPPGTVIRAATGTVVKKEKKEQKLSEMAKDGCKNVAEIVNLLNYGVKSLDELPCESQIARSGDIRHLKEYSFHTISVANQGSASGSVRKSVLPFVTGKQKSGDSFVLSQNSIAENGEEQFLAKTSVGDSIVSPPVDVQSFCIPTYSCKLCGREFRFEGKLHRHIEAVHQKKSIFTSDVKPGRGTRTHFLNYGNNTAAALGYEPLHMDSSSSSTLIVSGLPSNTMEEVHLTQPADINSSDITTDGTDTEPAVNNPEIEALRSEWDDDDDDEDEEDTDAEVRPSITKPQPIFNAPTSGQQLQQKNQPRQQHQQQILQQQRLHLRSVMSSAPVTTPMPIVTRNIQPMITTLTDVYSGGVVVNMNKLTGLIPKAETTTTNSRDPKIVSAETEKLSKEDSLDENSLDSQCQKLLLKLFDYHLLVKCGLGEDHVSVVLGRILQHYGVKMIEDYGQGQYEVLKYNLWRLMEWKVTTEQMEEFYSENKSVEEMMDDIMNERVPLVHHEIITQARAAEQLQQRQQQQQVEEMVVPHHIDETEHQHVVVEQQVEGEHVVVQATEQMIVDQSSGQHIVVQSVDQSQQHHQQIVVQGVAPGHHQQQHQQIIIQQQSGGSSNSTQLSNETAVLVQQVMGGHQLTGVTQVMLAHDVSPEMLQGAHIVTIDPTTGQVLSQVAADQVVLATHDGTIVNAGAHGVDSGQQQGAIVVNQEQIMMLQQQYSQQQSTAPS